MLRAADREAALDRGGLSKEAHDLVVFGQVAGDGAEACAAVLREFL
jgi:hypothetical protein